MSDDILRYYNEELSYLRQEGNQFAEKYPKIASRLNLGHGMVDDPLVGRLTESFAFLTARVRYQMDQEASHVTNHLLNLLYPHYPLPVPACSTVQFHPSDQLEQAHKIPRGSVLQSQTLSSQNCYFTSCYDVTLWPFHVTNTAYQRNAPIVSSMAGKKLKSCLSFELKSNQKEILFSNIKPDCVRFRIKATDSNAFLIYTLLMRHVKEIVLDYPEANGNTLNLSSDMIQSVGFCEEEALLSYPPNSFSGYRLLTEFYAFPEKFLYFDIVGLDQYVGTLETNAIKLHCFFDQYHAELEAMIVPDTLMLGCSPVINLFEQIGEPIQAHQKQHIYQVVADANCSQDATEVYQILSMDMSSTQQDQNISCSPYFGRKFSVDRKKKDLYWSVERKSCWEIGLYQVPGFETFVSFSEFAGKRNVTDRVIVTPKLLCTNRDLVRQLPLGPNKPDFHFRHTNHELVERINCVSKMTRPKYRDFKKDADLDLVTQLSLNYLSLTDGEAVDALRNILALYQDDPEKEGATISKGLMSVKTRQILERHPSNLKQGFCKGIEFSLTVNEQCFSESGIYLFGSVLHEFLTQSCSVNSFVKLIIFNQNHEELYRWKPKLGIRKIL